METKVANKYRDREQKLDEQEEKELLQEFSQIIERTVANTCYQLQASYSTIVNDPTVLPALALGSIAQLIGKTIGNIHPENRENTYEFVLEQMQNGIEETASPMNDLAKMKVMGNA